MLKEHTVIMDKMSVEQSVLVFEPMTPNALTITLLATRNRYNNPTLVAVKLRRATCRGLDVQMGQERRRVRLG